MTNVIKWKLDVFVTDGPSISLADQLSAEAYDKISATIPKGGKNTLVSIQPADKGQVGLLVIRSMSPEKDKPITYLLQENQPNDLNAVDMTNATILEGPHVLVGASLVNVLDAAPKFAVFKNAGTKDVEVEILVARNAVKAPSP
jgi:hypothetical protein